VPAIPAGDNRAATVVRGKRIAGMALVLPISAAANVDIVDTTIAGTDKSREPGL